MKSDLLGYGKELKRLTLKAFPKEEVYARPITLKERLRFLDGRASDAPMQQHEILFLATRNAEGGPYFDSPEEAAELAGTLGDELLTQVLLASGVDASAVERAEKKSDGSRN